MYDFSTYGTVSQKECLMQHSWGTLDWQQTPRTACSIAAKGNDQILQWLLNVIKTQVPDEKTKVSQK